MLGASWLQTPPIEYARSMGYHVITCDNRPDNPGHALANESFDVSTTDREGVLALAKDQNVDAVLAYASDPSVPAAAFAAAALGLPGNPPTSVDLLTHKHRYRAFLRDNDFLTPPFRSATSIEEARRELAQLSLPAIAKPVDSSGSKGVLRIDHLDELPAAFRRSLEFSRSGRVILEEYFARVGHQVTGDGFYRRRETCFSLSLSRTLQPSVEPNCAGG